MKRFRPFSSLKAMVSGFLTVGSTLTIAACYGVTQTYHYLTHGLVMDRITGQGIEGVQVCVSKGEYQECTLTDNIGQYAIEVPTSLYDTGFEICAKDIDGAQKGSYATTCRTVEALSDTYEIDFALDPLQE